MEKLPGLRLPLREAAASGTAALMAPVGRRGANEQTSAWVEELERLATEVGSLSPAARSAIRTVLDAVARDEGREPRQALEVRMRIDGISSQLSGLDQAPAVEQTGGQRATERARVAALALAPFASNAGASPTRA